MTIKSNEYSEKLTPHLEALLKKTGYARPLAKQFISDIKEQNKDVNDEYIDVSDDRNIRKEKYIYHRYPSKVLLFLTENCLGHCRFCFRKYIRLDKTITEKEFKNALRYIEERQEVNEVILSGGDPLFIKAERLISYIKRIRKLKNIRIIRIHTRCLTYAPELLSTQMIEEISKNQPIFFVFHINHALELTDIAIDKVKEMVDKGVLCFSQTALLHEVNDTEIDLKELLEKLISIRIKPYYLFHPDKVKGNSHFYVPLEKGKQLYRGLYNHISGLAMPIYLLNIPGGYGHCIMDLDYVCKEDVGLYKIKTWNNEEVIYHEIQ